MEWLTDSNNYLVNSKKHPNIDNNTEYVINSLFSSKYLLLTGDYSITSEKIQRIQKAEAFTLENPKNIPTDSPIYVIVNNTSDPSLEFAITLKNLVNSYNQNSSINVLNGKTTLQIKDGKVVKI